MTLKQITAIKKIEEEKNKLRSIHTEEEWRQRISRQIEKGNKLKAVKMYKDYYGVDLSKAKNAIENW